MLYRLVIPYDFISNLIGIPNLDDKIYGPMADTLKISSCYKVNPKYLGGKGHFGKKGDGWGPNGCSMQDIMDFRENWFDIKKDWPSEPYNLDLFQFDFGVKPPIERVVHTLGVHWNQVLVM